MIGNNLQWFNERRRTSIAASQTNRTVRSGRGPQRLTQTTNKRLHQRFPTGVPCGRHGRARVIDKRATLRQLLWYQYDKKKKKKYKKKR